MSVGCQEAARFVLFRLIKKRSFNLLFVFGSFFRTLAVNSVSDFVVVVVVQRGKVILKMMIMVHQVSCSKSEGDTDDEAAAAAADNDNDDEK